MIVAGTGHRPDKLGGFTSETQGRVNRFALKIIDVYQPTRIISGMAQGWDWAIAYAALKNDIPLIAVIPFAGFDKKWPSQAQNIYRHLIDLAYEVHYIAKTEVYHPAFYQMRNQWMVDHAEMILALWNGTEGGTKNCIDYANKVNKPVINLWDEWRKFNGETV